MKTPWKPVIFTALLFNMSANCLAYEQTPTEIDEISYSNNGAYQAAVLIKWQSQKSGKIYFKRFPNSGVSNSADKSAWIPAGKNQRINLRVLTGSTSSDLHNGDEVWAVISIAKGDTENCQKQRNKFIYKAGADARAKYSTRGTSMNDNRCRLINKPK